MLLFTIWWIGILLVLVALVQSFRTKTFGIYPYFYTYLASVLVSQFGLYFVHSEFPASYGKWFWRTEIPTLILGCGIVLEIFRHVLAPYPGAERFARIGGLFVFGAVFCLVLVYPSLTHGQTLARSMEDLERDLRTVQAIFLFGAIAIITYYGIALGKNIRGIIFGYALYIGTSLISLAVGPYASPWAHAIWKELQPLSYDVSLAVWIAALWSYHPNPAPSFPVRLGADYEALALRTRYAVDGLRSHLVRATKP